jgi:hypothetical protein
VSLDYATLDALRRNHPAWRLLLADSAPLVASFLHRAFVAPNVHEMAQADLVERLEDELFALRATLGAAAFPRAAREYLDEWAAANKLRSEPGTRSTPTRRREPAPRCR